MMKLMQFGWLVCALALQASAVEFYVETTGDDLNSGTAGAPFQTLEKAQLAVRSALPTATEPIQVWVSGGTYYLDQALEFGPADSGTVSVPETDIGGRMKRS